ncbi:MAG: sigma-70 family RNA polymerase sigma factor [Fuerstiella sp.]|nr:sigma-70 family RNA polymerase sigma factor [Fuerstiella sp.]
MQQATIENILSGDLDAYEAVVRQYQGVLLGYAANRLSDIDAAQEVVQLTFIRAYEQLNEYQPERDFGVWLCVICKHFILTELERQRRESRNLKKFSHALRLRVGEEMASAADDGQRDSLSALQECLKNLQAQAASVVRLRYDERQSCESIAESLGRTVTWVTSTLSRSRKALRACIESRPGQGATT